MQVTGKTRKIGIFGTKGAGKTTYLVALVHQMYNYAVSDRWEMDLTGPSHRFFIEKIKTLEQGEWLESTKKMEEFHFQLIHTSTGEVVELVTADIVGEAFQAAFSPCSEGEEEDTHPLREMIRSCQGYIFIIDPGRLLESTTKIEEVAVYRSLFSYLVEVRKLKPRQKLEEPVAFVFSKGDKYSDLIRRPKRFFYDKMRAVHGRSESLFRRYNVFLVSSVGAVEERGGEEKPVTPIEPQNVFEPFRWVRDQLLKR